MHPGHFWRNPSCWHPDRWKCDHCGAEYESSLVDPLPEANTPVAMEKTPKMLPSRYHPPKFSCEEIVLLKVMAS